jgi:hypothetical protein
MGDIVFVKPCLFKGRIETESWSGLKKYYEMMEREVQLEKQVSVTRSTCRPTNPIMPISKRFLI